MRKLAACVGTATLVAGRLATIAERLGDVDSADLIGTGKVGDRPRHPHDPVEAAGRQAHRGRRVGEQLGRQEQSVRRFMELSGDGVDDTA